MNHGNCGHWAHEPVMFTKTSSKLCLLKGLATVLKVNPPWGRLVRPNFRHSIALLLIHSSGYDQCAICTQGKMTENESVLQPSSCRSWRQLLLK